MNHPTQPDTLPPEARATHAAQPASRGVHHLALNTDDMKTMRLMALPDEVPQIQIPCIMVSRRIQYYLEGQLRRYYLLNQHLVTMESLTVFGDYEKKNTVVLPARLQVG
jgi:hypothetical protein